MSYCNEDFRLLCMQSAMVFNDVLVLQLGVKGLNGYWEHNFFECKFLQDDF